MGRLSGLWTDVRAHPVATALELGTLLASVGLFFALVVALARGPPLGESDPLWIAIVVVGAAVSVMWTVVLPVYDRVATGE